MKCKQCQKEVYGKQIAKGTGTCKVCYAKHDSIAESEKNTPEGKEIIEVITALNEEIENLPPEVEIPLDDLIHLEEESKKNQIITFLNKLFKRGT